MFANFQKLRMTIEELKRDIIQNFGYAYKAFGLNKLMGHVVALLIYSDKPLSLDEICENLERSKGPVSQIMKRLRDKKLIRKVWQPQTRKDYYEIEPEIFENAFKNNLELIKQNTKLAKNLQNSINGNSGNGLDLLLKRLGEMEHFYRLMEDYNTKFLEEWTKVREEYYKLK